jgi:prefoldin subunit 5
MPLANAVKELKTVNEGLKKENDVLKKELNDLANRVSLLEKKNQKK